MEKYFKNVFFIMFGSKSKAHVLLYFLRSKPRQGVGKIARDGDKPQWVMGGPAPTHNRYFGLLSMHVCAQL